MALEIDVTERMYVSQERSYILKQGKRILVTPGVNGIAQVRRFSSGVLLETFVITEAQTYGEYQLDMKFSVKCIAESVSVSMGSENDEAGGNGDLISANNLSDLQDVEAARDNLGLGAMAVQDAVYVTAYGADPTGVADSTAAFIAAALAAPGYSNVEFGSDVPKPINVDVHVPPGNYLLLSKVKTQKRVTWHFADGAKVSDDTMLTSIISRSGRIGAEHMGIGSNACSTSSRANRLDLDKSAGVMGIHTQADLGVHGAFHSVTAFADNFTRPCARLTGTTFTATTVTFTNSVDFDDFKVGTTLTVGKHGGAIMAFVESWNVDTKTLTVKAWNKHTGTPGTTETPADGSVVLINYFRKIWAHNANVMLQPGADTEQAAGFELGLVNNQDNVSQTYSSSGRYLWGYDCANLGSKTSSTAFIARHDFIEGFTSRGPMYGFRVLPGLVPDKDLTLIGFSYEKESGAAFRSTMGGQTSWRVSAEGNMEIGRMDTAQTTRLDFHSSGNVNDYDARLSVTGGSGTAGEGGLRYDAAIHTFNGAIHMGSPTVGVSGSLAIKQSADGIKCIHLQRFTDSSPTGYLLSVTNTANTEILASIDVTGKLTGAALNTHTIPGGTGTLALTSNITDSGLSTTDITTNNATTLKHGFLPKLSGNATEFLNGSGAWSKPYQADTGWTAMTGTADESTALATSTVTLEQLAERVKALQDILAVHGLIAS